MPLELKELLLLPMQRVLRYPLIIENLMKCSGKNHPDYSQLLVALDGMRDLNMHINQTKADMEDTIKPLQTLEKLIKNSKMQKLFPPIDSMGKLICYSKAYKWETAVNLNAESSSLPGRRRESCDRDALDGIHVMVLTNFLIAFKLQLVNRNGIIYLQVKQRESPLRNPIYLKKGQINRVTKVSSTFKPTESDSEKKWLVILILGEEIGFEIA